jgi:hypothetical protein
MSDSIYAYKGKYWKVIHNFQYTGESVPFTLEPGKYLLICHGAQGGLGAINSINYGGVAMGVLDLKSSTQMYAVVGGNGGSYVDKSTPGVGGFNGGGNGGKSYGNSYVTGAGGGGSSDIRLLPPDSPTKQLTIEKTLPEEYQEVEYLQSTGTQYLDTWITPTANMKAEVKYASNSTGQTSGVFGASFANNTISIVQNNNLLNIELGKTSIGLTDDTEIHVSVLDTKNAKVYHDGVEQSGSFSSDIPNKTLTIFGRRTNETTLYYGKCKIYYTKIWKDDSVIRYYIPCYRKSDNVCGMYDIVTDTFLTNRGTGTFSKGEDIAEATTFQYDITVNSLYSRIIVAGGGGGGTNISSSAGFPNYTGNGGGVVAGYPAMNESGVNHFAYASQSSGYEFGIGMDAPYKSGSNQSAGMEGASGGGGGWYGGYACGSTNLSVSSSNGGGGSGYVLTEDSYKPEGYSVDETFYMTDAFLDGGGAIQPQIIICVQVDMFNIGDKITFPCIGETEHVILPVGKYIVECYGGDGGCRGDTGVSSRGGYAKGTLNLPFSIDTYVNVAGSGIGTGLLDSGDWSMMNRPTLMFNGGGAPGTMGDIKSCAGGGASDVRIGSNSLYARVIVAGGAGGEGAVGKTGGAGGGVKGANQPYTSYGTNEGGGTQTGSPSNSPYNQVDGGFGYGGSGVTISSSGYGGAGGSGWYGGSGTYPNSGSDRMKGGSGGSGYVLTEDSYKPEGYLLGEECYMTDTVLTTGGNTLPVGHTAVTMEVLDCSFILILCHDEDGYKRYDSESNSWVYLSTLITPELFETYGSYTIPTDEGLLNEFEVVIYDKSNNVSNLNLNVIPPRQIISRTISSTMKVDNVFTDIEFDNDVYDTNIGIHRKGVGSDAKITIDVIVDKKQESDENIRLFCVQLYGRGSVSSNHKVIPRPEPVEREGKQYLLTVGTSNTIPVKYRQINKYVSEDVGQLTGTLYSHVSCEHNRLLYIGILVGSTFRLQKLNLLTNALDHIIDIPQSSIGNYYIGDILADDDYLYITNSANGNSSYRSIYRLNLSDHTISSFTSPSGQNFQCYGKMCWFDKRTIVIGHQYGFMLFDTKTTQWAVKTQSSSYGSRDEMSVGKRLLMSHYYTTSTTSPAIYRTDLGTFDQITLPSSAISISCYENGKFYIAQTNYLHIYDEETETIERSVVIPWTNPKTIDIADGVVYATQKGSNTMYIYDTKNDMFRRIILPWTIPNVNAGYVTRPTTFKGYYFIPYITMGIVNYTTAAKYNLGYKFNQYISIYNSNEESKYTYDSRFVSFKDSYMTIHDGIVTVPFEVIDESNHFKSASIDKSQYTKIKSISFDTSST